MQIATHPSNVSFSSLNVSFLLLETTCLDELYWDEYKFTNDQF
uniref:Uncharacterized protein n=1 Tax=Arundo donax TaxID=35708 RepID=A0A0A9BB97_ARUDO